MSLYNPNVPTGTVPLNVDYQNIRNNFTGLNNNYIIDHVPFDNVDATITGYHKVVHMVPSVGAPASVAGIGELYCRTINDGINNDEELFYQTGSGRIIQLTRNFVPVTTANNGRTFIAGGVIIQWGFVNGTHGGNSVFNGGDSGTVTFAQAFSSACFGVQINPVYGTAPGVPSGTATVSYDLNTLSTTKFDWTFISSSAAYKRFFWMAIGI